MKSIVFLYAGFATAHAFETVFSSRSAFDRALVWADSVAGAAGVFVAVVPGTEDAVRKAVQQAGKKCTIIKKDSWTTAALLSQLAESCSRTGADCVVYTAADRPFLDARLTAAVLSDHERYLAEYTFADGYPQGFAPEVIAAGTARLLASLAQESQKAAGDAPVSADSIFSVMRGDINSFEVESVLAPADYRMLRLDFSCTGKASLLACERLYARALDTQTPFFAEELTELAKKDASVQQTVPAFYSVQLTPLHSTAAVYNPFIRAYAERTGTEPVAGRLTGETPCMSLEQFKALVRQAADFSESAVIGLSAWGDPLELVGIADYVAAVAAYPSLSVLIETDGLALSDEVLASVAEVARAAPARSGAPLPLLTWIVQVDAATPATYAAVHGVRDGEACFAKAVAAVRRLAGEFPGAVYPQMVRMNANEGELEAFYRFWHDKDSASGGRLIIQKYDSFCGLLPDEKPADLAPLERMACWHLKRDLTVLCDGTVPFCREYVLDGVRGNVFTDGIAAIWERTRTDVAAHLAGEYDGKCRDCDEYYTFSF